MKDSVGPSPSQNLTKLQHSGSNTAPPIATKRRKGTTLHRPILFGNTATPISQQGGDSLEQNAAHTHRWTLYVRGLHHEDISYYVQRVEFKLHESFQPPIRGTLQPFN
jgi:YEATS domain-containing protein 4